MSVDDLTKVEEAQQAILKKLHDGKAGAQFTREVRESLLFQYNWTELLSAAPIAITLVGACHVAAWPPEAAAIDLGEATPMEGFKYLQVTAKPTLRACLVFVANQGDKAFRKAGSNMSAIAGTSKELIETVSRIIRAIQDLPETQRNLANELIKLRRMSINCLEYAQDTEKAFDTWLLSVSEFHQASVQKHGATEQESQANDSAQLKADIELSFTNKGIEIAGATLERVKEILIECISILVELNVQISKLTTFFNALSTMVNVIIDTKVKNFDTDVTAIGQETAQMDFLKLNNLDIETVYISTRQIKAYFDLLQMICQMYTNVHTQYINPGLDLLTELSKVTNDPKEVAPKRDKLYQFTDNATKAINEIVAEKQREISDGLQDRIDIIAEQTDILHKLAFPCLQLA